MMEVANIIQINNEKYSKCAILQTHKSLHDIKSELTSRAEILNVDGSLLIDTLFHSGNSKFRFWSVDVNNGIVNWASLKVVTLDKRCSIRAEIVKELNNNIDFLNHSILSTVQKKLICKGVGI